MFGWEFPPHIAGGLGTACYGMTRGLAQHGVKVIFVMPKAYGDEDQQFVRVVNASFGQRRKMLRNSLRAAFGDFGGAEHPFFSQRAEQLSVADFVALTQWVEQRIGG